MLKTISALRTKKVIWIVILGSLGIHFLALIVFASVKLAAHLAAEDPEFEAPPTVMIEPPPAPVIDQIVKLSQDTSPVRPNTIVVNNPLDVDLPAIEVSEVKSSQAIFGRGSGGFGSGSGAARPREFEANFFGASASGNRIAFIVDYSHSMKKNNREALMRAELSRSITELPDGMEIAVVFFAGPVWLPGDNVASEVKSKWVTSAKEKFYSYRPKKLSDLPEPNWRPVSGGVKNSLIRDVKNDPLVLGTVWDLPFYTVFQMDPLPDTIFFMTDGATSQKRGLQSIRGMIDQLKKNDVEIPVINTIGMEVESKSKSSLRELARITGGEAVFLDAAAYAKENDIDLSKFSKKSGRGGRGSAPVVPDDKYPLELIL